ncbi:SRPBCC family protein [Fodinicola feengrottensis]|uniref:SRPBCC family protein n=1 Tax=Fodinicola feengrottensis TaxID=435914 RepID=A0ABP4U5D7_9ACTN
MPKVYASAIVPADADQVWRLAGDFNGLASWHPAIADSRLTAGDASSIGAVRELKTPDGGLIEEEQIARDERNRTYTYTFTQSPFPVRSYVSVFRVAPVTATNQAFVEWSAVYDAEAADEAAMNELFGNGVFGGGLAALVKRFSAA